MAKRAVRSEATGSVTIHLTDYVEPGADAMAVLVMEGEKQHTYTGLDKAFSGAITAALALGDFKAKTGSVEVLPAVGFAKRIMLVGAGKKSKVDSDTVRWAGGAIIKAARNLKLSRVGVAFHQLESAGVESEQIAEWLSEGITLGGFVFDEFKGVKKNDGEAVKAGPITVELMHKKKDRHAPLREAIRVGQAIGNAANFTRRIASLPGNVLNPATLVDEARAFAKREGFKLRVIDWQEASRLGMGGLIGVGQGSVHPPALIVLEYAGIKNGDTIAVVGKAVTFDTGGISIKPAADMDQMIYDKSGGMAVFGILQAAKALGIKKKIVGLIPTAENSVSDAAYRPGDILKLFNGKTVEITNTDAEGRLILADALSWAAKEYNPAVMIDMATLTGGMVIAMGSVYAGLMANDDALAAALEKAGQASGEWLWRLPLHERYAKMMEGAHADLQNSAGREAHPIQGGVFLQEFVPAAIKWAHLDIAGTAHPKKDDRYLSKGASGFGVRVVTEYLRRLA